MPKLNERVRNILHNSDFNDMPFDERKRIRKYIHEQQICDLWQVLNGNKDLTNQRWRGKIQDWLENSVTSYERKYRQVNKDTGSEEL